MMATVTVEDSTKIAVSAPQMTLEEGWNHIQTHVRVHE